MKHIEELVYKGMVLDEHGGWIPLAEKLHKEKEFLRHLERGEILVNGLWTEMTFLSKGTGNPEETRHILLDPSAAVTEETVLSHCAIPEETVSVSTETLDNESAEGAPVESESDYAPETKMFSIARSGQSASSSVAAATEASMGDGAAVDKMHDGCSLDNKSISESGRARQETTESEFEETVLYSINMLRQTADRNPHASEAGNADGARLSPSVHAVDDSNSDIVRPDRKSAVGWVLAIILAVILLACGIWLFR
ncbi:MAG: hypothetical protein JXA18_03230 [Chitinispirillaceae bacterium]|nr:hypothetical protein [Chitinispirillaceae bacterium]